MNPIITPPSTRKLRGYAIDPSLSTSLSTASINELTYRVPWEELDQRKQGGASFPAGEYIEIVDVDPATGKAYAPVDLDHPYVLSQDGLPPSVSNPQFHQQMVYAVVMTTIMNFEQALGRKIQWSENIRVPDSASTETGSRDEVQFDFVGRLRIYPHALRQANAFYDPNRKALLFGYFNAGETNAQLQLPGGTVFTCLSHDIIAHETTHAILDGLHRRYIEPTHPDTRAFHEAFADIVALFQHFSFPEVLKHQIALTRGDLLQQNFLGQLAQQFGKAIGNYGGLRDAIGRYDDNGHWEPLEPDPNAYKKVMGFHARGAILVAAIFDAFLSIYRQRIRRVMRIATGGSGVLPDGELHPDLVDQLAEEAAKTAKDVLRICIRALDYCPPIDITFGDYLRAIITADTDMVNDDRFGYRVAFVEAFQKRGISVHGLKSMAIEDLRHKLHPQELTRRQENQLGIFLRKLKESVGYLSDRKEIYEKTKEFIRGKQGLHKRIESRFVADDPGEKFSMLTGLMFPGDQNQTESKGLEFAYLTSETASYAVSNVWLAHRATPDGEIVNNVVITLVQKRGVRFTIEGKDVKVDEEGFFVPDHTKQEDRGENHIVFRGGCTLIFDLDTLRLRYAIKKDVDDRSRMIRQFKFERGLQQDQATYFDTEAMNRLAGPFAVMHSHMDQPGGQDGRE